MSSFLPAVPKGARHRRCRSLDMPRPHDLSFLSNTDLNLQSIPEQKPVSNFEKSMSKMSPRSRATWERAKTRFRAALPGHHDPHELEKTDFREMYHLHWSPDEMWKTLEHVISRHAKKAEVSTSKKRGLSRYKSSRSEQDDVVLDDVRNFLLPTTTVTSLDALLNFFFLS